MIMLSDAVEYAKPVVENWDFYGKSWNCSDNKNRFTFRYFVFVGKQYHRVS